MVYNKVMKTCIWISVIALIASTAVFATTDLAVKDNELIGGVMNVLQKIQTYSWPVAVIVLVYALYQYYVVGSEAFEQKVSGQKLIVGLSVFMAIIQCLPLVYAIITIGF
ncbi:MAG: hypothetical protein IJ272_03450 [Clostridia bacterium]|nr:hypothetical protein [Clostridia bacterium]